MKWINSKACKDGSYNIRESYMLVQWAVTLNLLPEMLEIQDQHFQNWFQNIVWTPLIMLLSYYSKCLVCVTYS